MRAGLIVVKLGMSRILTSDGIHVPVTLCQLDNCRVIFTKKLEKKNCYLFQIGSGLAKPNKVSKPLKGYFSKIKVLPPKKIVEFHVDEDMNISKDHIFTVDYFKKGQFVDAKSISIGKGFAGTMKRYNFGGMSASHGVSVSHRSQGSTGQCQDPGRVFKGTKMSGHMGAKKVTIQNLLVYHLDPKNNLIALKGAVPGCDGSYVILKDAIKKHKN